MCGDQLEFCPHRMLGKDARKCQIYLHAYSTFTLRCQKPCFMDFLLSFNCTIILRERAVVCPSYEEKFLESVGLRI